MGEIGSNRISYSCFRYSGPLKGGSKEGDKEQIQDKHGHKRERIWTERRWHTCKDWFSRQTSSLLLLGPKPFGPACNFGAAVRWDMSALAKAWKSRLQGAQYSDGEVTRREVWSCYPENLGSVWRRWYKYVTVVQMSDLFENCQRVLESVYPFPSLRCSSSRWQSAVRMGGI